MTHSCVIHPALKAPLSHASEGSKYGRLFPDLPALDVSEDLLLALGRAGSALDAGGEAADNPRTPAGFTFLGQFIAHDITRDVSLLAHHANVGELRNFRTPRLDLESVYGPGPANAPFLYDALDPDKFLLGVNGAGRAGDLPRNAQGVALVGDPRDDTHTVISQLHLAFLKFHNAVVDHLRTRGMPKGALFEEARRTARWHYQWIVLREFLPLTVGDNLVTRVLAEGPRFFEPLRGVRIPVEFADAAYRFGHPQIRPTYRLARGGPECTVFPDLVGFRPVPPEMVVDWSLFFGVPGAGAPQASKRIGVRLAGPLMHLPEAMVGETSRPEEASLAYRDLERGVDCDLPSGEAVAGVMGERPLTPGQVGLERFGWKGETPLWFYVLREAEVLHSGERLGPVGDRIVAEVLLGLLMADPTAYPGVRPDWVPVLPSSIPGTFGMGDLVAFARRVDGSSA